MAFLKKRVALSTNYPFATVEPNIEVVAVPDYRFSSLAKLVKNEEHMEQLPPIVPSVVEFVDIAGLVKGASTGEGLGNQFLPHLLNVGRIAPSIFATWLILRSFGNFMTAFKKTVSVSSQMN